MDISLIHIAASGYTGDVCHCDIAAHPDFSKLTVDGSDKHYRILTYINMYVSFTL